MKVLVATRATQGARRGDFTQCITGELVWLLQPCEKGILKPYGKCDCGRVFEGMSSHRSTTTALVRNIPGLTRADYEEALRACVESQGWCDICRVQPVTDLVDELVALAEGWPEGAVIERRVFELSMRAQLPKRSGDGG